MSNPIDSLSPDERKAISAQFREELREEHQERTEAQAERERKTTERRSARKSREEALAESELKEQLRTEFHKDNGYQLYTDSAGREHWLTPEEYEWRMAARARRDSRRRTYEPSIWVRQKQLVMYGSAILLAVALGLYLVK